MKIQDFIARATTDIKFFEAVWIYKNSRNNIVYPLEMLEKDWLEQFQTFQDQKHSKEDIETSC